MDERAVVKLAKELQTATAKNASPSTIIAHLNELKTNLKATEDLLRSTKIGVVVNRSKQHSDPAVARLASDIVRKWREDVQKQKSRRASPADPSRKGAAGSSGAASPAHHNGAETKSDLPTVPLDQRDHKKDQVSINRTNQATRDSCIGLIYNGLAYNSPNPSSEILSKAIAVEAAGFDKHGPETNSEYSMKMRSLYMNLKNKTNPELRKKVLGGEIAADKLVVMTTEELKTKERKAEDQKIHRENMKDSQMPKAERSTSVHLRCKNPSCGPGTVAYTQAQTRRWVSLLSNRDPAGSVLRLTLLLLQTWLTWT